MGVSNPKTTPVSCVEETEVSSDAECYGLYHNICSPKTVARSPYFATVEINGVPLTMEIDTGAARSTVCEVTYKKLLSAYPTKTVNIRLRSYTGEVVPVVGEIEIPVKYPGNEKMTMKLLVVNGKKPSLLGRDWLSLLKMNWTDIFSVKTDDQPALNQLLSQYEELFLPNTEGIQGHKAHLNLKPNQTPPFQKARPVPYSLRPAVEEELVRLERDGILIPVETCVCSSPTVNVPKFRDDNLSVRICGDYKKVNLCLEDDKYPLPTAQDLFAKLASDGKKPRVFSTLDLSGAFNQLKLDDESVPLLTLNTHTGLYPINGLSYCVKTAPSLFKATMDKILSGIDNVMCFIDDILIIGESEADNLKTLSQVFTRLKTYNMHLNKVKCRYLQPSVQYLGHILSEEGVKPVKDKIDAMKNAPAPKDLTELQSFLGLVNYYGIFIPSLSTLLQPLYARLNAGVKWSWDIECEQAFNKLKSVLSSEAVLVHYDSSKPLILSTDASPYGIGAVISHRMEDGSEKPVAYASRTLSQAERNYSQIEKETLGIIYGVKKFNMYLYGRPFTLVTDHPPLTGIFGLRMEFQHWRLLACKDGP